MVSNYGIGNLGSMQEIGQDISLAASAASLATGGLAVAGVISGAAAGPVGLAIGGAALVAGLIAKQFAGCGPTCTVTSDAANQIEPLMQQNLAAWHSSTKTRSEQAIALNNFDTLWSKLQQFCQSGQFGTAGQNCVADRKAGACKWKDSNGECWNWFIGYRDPIANDPRVVNDTAVGISTSGVASGLIESISNISNSSGDGMILPVILLIGGGLILYGD